MLPSTWKNKCQTSIACGWPEPLKQTSSKSGQPVKISAKVEVSSSADGVGFLVFPLGGSGNHGAPETESVYSEMEQVTGRMEERKKDSGVEAHYRLKAQIC